MPGQQGLVLGSGGYDVPSRMPPRFVRALDAATGRRKWEYLSSPAALDYSGLLATAGGLVFGASAGFCFALDADTGREVWRVSLGGKTMAAPISFTVDGRQVIAVAAGRALFVFGL
jgi:alcohol dehydrogenase (cytochrome c)